MGSKRRRKTSSAWRQVCPAGGIWGRRGWVSGGRVLRLAAAWERKGGWWDAEGGGAAEEGPLCQDKRGPLLERQTGSV